LFLPRSDKKLNIREGFQDHRNNENNLETNPEIISRIIQSYKLAKEAQKQCDAPFKIRGLWEEWIKVNYEDVLEALNSEDIPKLSSIYENLFREQCGIGTGGYDEYIRYKSIFGSFYIKYVWSSYKKILEESNFEIKKIKFPSIGNPCGVMCGGKVLPIETLRHAYRANEIVNLLSGIKPKTIVEIGGGLGGLAYQVMAQLESDKAKFILFDIPEVLTLSSFFLLSAMPDKKIRLFGEGPISSSDSEDYDLALFPHFTINQLKDSSVDLFYNSCSFSEMDSQCARENLKIIERSSRQYFMHDNHDTEFIFKYPDNSVSKNIIGSKLIPRPSAFKRIYKKPRVHGLPEDKSFVHFEYLYEKLKDD
jgi:putative sugar O-methyltransferase